MTLPFRRRHHDDDSSHDRARALLSDELDEPLSAGESTWLEDHLAGCSECSADRRAYLEDRALLRTLRESPPMPPRDLWARTAAAIDREAAGRAAPAALRGLTPPPAWRLPLGVLSGAVLALLIVAVALQPGASTLQPGATGGASEVARASSPVGPTILPIPNAQSVVWVEQTADGQYALVSAPVDQACPSTDPSCPPLAPSSPTPLELGSSPKAITLSPQSNQVAVVGQANVTILAVPTPRPSGETATPATPTPVATATAQPTRSATPTASARATASPAIQPSASVTTLPNGQVIISGVTVVGDVGYSSDGTWVAFSAEPAAGDGGPYLYVWHVGDGAAHQVTSDGMTYFAGWYGNAVVASSVSPSSAEGSVGPSSTAPGTPSQAPATSPAAGPSSSPRDTPVIEGRATSFLIDPASGARSVFRIADVWLPSIDPTGRFVTYWAGTLVAVTDVAGGSRRITTWRPGTGHLVLDGWSAPLAAPASESAAPGGSSLGSPTDEPAIPGSVGTPGPAPSQGEAVGPAGTPIELAAGQILAFDTRFDPTGTRLGTWVADSGDPTVGRLWLTLLDPGTGQPSSNPDALPAPGVPAARGFSILAGRLGWVTPQGQNGQPASVQVLAWSGDAFGQVQTVPGGTFQIVH